MKGPADSKVEEDVVVVANAQVDNAVLSGFEVEGTSLMEDEASQDDREGF